MELPVAAARRAEGREEPSVGRELLDAVVTPVGHVHVAVRIGRHSPRQVELAIAAPLRSEIAQEPAIAHELLYAVVVVIHHVEVVVPVESQARGAVELPIARSRLAPRREEGSGRVENGDPIGLLVADIDLPLPVDRHRRRPDELAVALAEGGEGAEVLAVQVAYGNPHPARVAFEGPAHGVELPVGADSRVGWIVEAPSLHRRKPDGVAIAEEVGSRLRFGRAHGCPLAALEVVGRRDDLYRVRYSAVGLAVRAWANLEVALLRGEVDQRGARLGRHGDGSNLVQAAIYQSLGRDRRPQGGLDILDHRSHAGLA